MSFCGGLNQMVDSGDGIALLHSLYTHSANSSCTRTTFLEAWLFQSQNMISLFQKRRRNVPVH